MEIFEDFSKPGELSQPMALQKVTQYELFALISAQKRNFKMKRIKFLRTKKWATNHALVARVPWRRTHAKSNKKTIRLLRLKASGILKKL